MSRFLVLAYLSLHSFAAYAAGVRVVFDPSKPEVGPFPTDYLTAPATNTKTARQVRMPAPSDCNAQPNLCQESWLASNFDGFNPQGRVRIRFSAAINPDTLPGSLSLVARENLTAEEAGVHKVNDTIQLNQIVFDPVTNTAYAKPDGPMDQHRRYLLVVTDALKDTAGDPVEPDPAYTACASDAATDDYCKALNAAVKASGVSAKIVAASLYSTMSVTAWLEKARDDLGNYSPSATSAGFYPLQDIASFTWRLQTTVDPAFLTDVSLPVELIQSGVRGIGFGTYPSPVHAGPDHVIPPVASNDRLPADLSVDQIHYAVYLPVREKPASGYPVVIYGHGLGDSQFGGPALVGATLASNGFATIAIDAVGHGFGPNSKVLLNTRSAGPVEIAAGGRGFDLNVDGRIDTGEGCAAVASSPLGLRDCLRQTAVDLLQLVRVIKAGIDVDGDGVPDLDPRQIFYVGQSLGSLSGTMMVAVDGSVQQATFNSGGGSIIDIARWSKTLHSMTVQNLALRFPSLLNLGADYDENYVLRNQPPQVISVAGAIDIQNALEMQEWLQADGDPALFASHLKLSPLAGTSAKSVLWQFARSDATIPNNTASTLVRNAGMQDSLWLYRHDTARSLNPNLPVDPHQYLTGYVSVDNPFNFFARPIATATQLQIVQFFTTGEIADPNTLDLALAFSPLPLFEKPAALPEDLNYLEP